MINIFNEISTKELVALKKSLEATTILLKKGMVLNKILYSNVLGIVITGHLQVIREDYDGNRIVIEDYTTDMMFGTAISSLNSEDCFLIAKEDSSLLIMDYDRILNNSNKKLKGYVELLKNLIEITTDEIEKKNIRIEILTKKTIRARLLTYFEINAKNKTVYLPFSYTDLADYLAIDRCAMTRELKNMKDEGFIETKGRKIKLNM